MINSHIGHVAYNINPANAGFYRDLMTFLGWSPIFEQEGILGVADKTGASLWFMGMAKAVDNDYDGPGVNHLAFSVPMQSDVDAAAGMAPGLDVTHNRVPPAQTFPNGCHIVELEIDPDTGTVAIERYTIVDDFGRTINPLLLDGRCMAGSCRGSARRCSSMRCTIPTVASFCPARSWITRCRAPATCHPSPSPRATCPRPRTRSASRAPARPAASARRPR